MKRGPKEQSKELRQALKLKRAIQKYMKLSDFEALKLAISILEENR